ncbi:uncharacterized protein TA13435 [Theileria annulata]|uniref:Uncharacterized protein n=1 Tax=Theileria annulata TaxID=5874 RepID=Q4UEI8_THEAN|nr:uncharacterized protein TA13435 [Theileria annulata]CAI74501.1 hypothetical protein TA13435 [Theileria annulata]|eukprot:XP_952233.1 hypothetical protein TA13435 [Theileria annulata]
MEDYQKWTRREVKEKRKVEYRFFPNRTPGQTFFVSVLMGFSVMGLAYMILEISKKLQEKKANKLKFQRNLSKTYIPMESVSKLIINVP